MIKAPWVPVHSAASRPERCSLQQVESGAFSLREQMRVGHQSSRSSSRPRGPRGWLMAGIITSCFGGRLTLKKYFHRPCCFSLCSSPFNLTSSHDFNDHFPVLCPELQAEPPVFLQSTLPLGFFSLSVKLLGSLDPNLGHLW